MTIVSSNTIHQHCSVCKADFDMDIIKQGSTEDVLWLKCPGCQGFLPYMPKEDLEDDLPEEKAVAIEDLDVEHAKEYSEADEYQIGEVIHHRSWNDFGKIVAKIYRVGAVFPLRKVFMVGLEQTFVSVSDTSDVKTGIGDLTIRGSARAWGRPRRAVYLLGFLATGTTKQEYFPYSSKTLDI